MWAWWVTKGIGGQGRGRGQGIGWWCWGNERRGWEIERQRTWTGGVDDGVDGVMIGRVVG